ncbi:hypothetical protein [Nonomuraea sp. SYSU D8015]|uniref:hypothetical protein n=1 Tax=Nonomuraea sp. SYSU D8015 TaxID=2593644 RepID=UPI0016607916|nr:hypothetical protein [Nonomuraea sp. SYSU D8015]
MLNDRCPGSYDDRLIVWSRDDLGPAPEAAEMPLRAADETLAERAHRQRDILAAPPSMRGFRPAPAPAVRRA